MCGWTTGSPAYSVSSSGSLMRVTLRVMAHHLVPVRMEIIWQVSILKTKALPFLSYCFYPQATDTTDITDSTCPYTLSICITFLFSDIYQVHLWCRWFPKWSIACKRGSQECKCFICFVRVSRFWEHRRAGRGNLWRKVNPLILNLDTMECSVRFHNNTVLTLA